MARNGEWDELATGPTQTSKKAAEAMFHWPASCLSAAKAAGPRAIGGYRRQKPNFQLDGNVET